jgi:hypothetical protein
MQEENHKVFNNITEWFGDDHGLAVIDGEFRWFLHAAWKKGVTWCFA